MFCIMFNLGELNSAEIEVFLEFDWIRNVIRHKTNDQCYQFIPDGNKVT